MVIKEFQKNNESVQIYIEPNGAFSVIHTLGEKTLSYDCYGCFKKSALNRFYKIRKSMCM